MAAESPGRASGRPRAPEARARGSLRYPLFDAHFHVIDARFPLIPNEGFLPDPFPVAQYAARMKEYDLRGGAVVTGSFQACDQTYLIDALGRLGPGFVGVTQLPEGVSDNEILRLHAAGVRALRCNLRRGGAAGLRDLDRLARRVHDLASWPTELYVDASELAPLVATISAWPAVSIDHLGLSASGMPTLLRLAERGVRVKATGFGRVDFDVAAALRALASANPGALMFGTDLPSTRAPRPYADADYALVAECLGEAHATQVFHDNAVAHYGLRQSR